MKTSPSTIFENFKHVKTTGTSILDRTYFATIDVIVVTGYFFWKKEIKISDVVICRDPGMPWFFIDSGELVIGYEVEKLARSYTARTGIKV